MERLNIFIDRSMVKNYLPFLNATITVLIMLIIFSISFIQILGMLHSYVSAFLLAIICSSVPIILLDIAGKYNSNKVFEMIPDFLSVLKSWLLIKKDFIYAMEKSIDDVPEPLNYYLKQCVAQIKGGISPIIALELMALKVDSRYFDKIIINIQQSFISKGDVIKLISSIENEAYLLHDEYQRRKITNFIDKILLYVLMIISLFIAYYILIIDPSYKMFYTNTSFGKVVLNTCTGLFFICFIINLKINKIKS